MTSNNGAPGERNDYYCPVCGEAIVFMWIWQDPASSRIRMFCEACSHLDEYRRLPKPERTIYSLEGFQRFAGRRLLAHVRARELAKGRGEAGSGERTL